MKNEFANSPGGKPGRDRVVVRAAKPRRRLAYRPLATNRHREVGMATSTNLVLRRHVIAALVLGAVTASILFDLVPTAPASTVREFRPTAIAAAPPPTETVLVRLPAANRDRALRQAARDVRARQSADADPGQALARARHLMAVMRQSGDARLAGYAESLLIAPALAALPAARLALADLYQHQHRFEAAENLLAELRQRAAGEVTVWLLSANVARVQGRLADAMAACNQAQRLELSAWTAVCRADLLMLRGDDQAWSQLHQTLAGLDRRVVDGDAALAGWLGDLADRAGAPEQAERYFKRAMLLGASPYVVDRYLRFLIERGELDAAQNIMQWWLVRHPDEQRVSQVNQVLLASARGNPEQAQQLAQRFVAGSVPASENSDRVHWRELTRVALATEPGATQALSLARENWARQKEPVDARLLAQAAAQSRAADVSDQLRAELRRLGMQGVLDNLVREGLV